MSKTRYFPTRTLKDSGEPKHYATWDLPYPLHGPKEIDLVSIGQTFDHTWQLGDRMDKLANKYFGDDEYWWIIALINNIPYALGVAPGTVLKIPTDVVPILEQLDMV